MSPLPPAPPDGIARGGEARRGAAPRHFPDDDAPHLRRRRPDPRGRRRGPRHHDQPGAGAGAGSWPSPTASGPATGWTPSWWPCAFPNLLRELFAEGALNAAFVPVFTRRLKAAGRDAAWRLGAQVINHLAVVTGVIAVTGIVFAEPVTRLLAGGYQAVPGKFELTVQLTRIVLPFLTAGCGGRRLHGHAQLAAALLRARGVARRLQPLPHRQRRRHRAADAGGRARPDHGGGGRGARRRGGADRGAVVGAPARGVPAPARPGPGRRGAAGGRGADGAGDGRGGRAAGERGRQHLPRPWRGHRRGLVVDERVPADVPPPGGARDVGRHRDPAGGGPPRQGRRPRRGSPRPSPTGCA